MMDHWCIYDKNRKKYGPYSAEQLKAFIQQNKVDDSHIIVNNDKTYNVQQAALELDISPQRKIAKFEIIKELGRGGMGVVYHARDTYLQHECAVKFIHFNQSADSLATKRFISEAQSVAQLDHPNIIKIKELNSYSDAQGNNMYYFSMDYVEGISFAHYIKKPISLKKKLQMFFQICEGVAYAHRHKIIHRDLKPQNIIVSQQGTPVILDFGLARNLQKEENITKTGDFVGTPKYIAPEVMHGKKADQRCDIYALGVMLYEILTGFSPFNGENVIELLFQVSHTDAVPPSKVNGSIKKDTSLEIICLKCLEKNPEKRLSCASFLSQEIQCILANKPTQTKPPGFLAQQVIWCRKNRRLLVATAVIFLLAALAIWTVQNQQHQKEIIARDAQIDVRDAEIFHRSAQSISNNVEQFYEKFSRLKGMKSIVADIKMQYQRLEKYIDNKDHKFLSSQQQNLLNFLERSQAIMRYLVLPSIPKIESSIPIENIDGQFELSTANHIAIVDKDERLFAAKIEDSAQKISFERPLATTCRKLAFSPNGKWLATFELDEEGQKICCLYRTESFQKVLRAKTSNSVRVSFAFSTSSKYFAYHDREHGICIVDLTQNIVSKNIPTDGLACYFKFSDNDKHMIYRLNNDYYYAYNLRSQSTKKKINYVSNLFPLWHDNRFTFFGCDFLESYDPKSKKITKHDFVTVSREDLITSAISPDKKTLIWGSTYGNISYLKKIKNNKFRMTHKKQAQGRIKRIGFLNDQLLFIHDATNYFYVRDLATKEIIYREANVLAVEKVGKRLQVVIRDSEKLLTQRWNIPYALQQILKPNKQTSKILAMAARAVQTQAFIAEPCILVQKDSSIEKVILSLRKALIIWEKQGDLYKHNNAKRTVFFDIWATRISQDHKWIALITGTRNSRQNIILVESDKITPQNIEKGYRIIHGNKLHGKRVDQWKDEFYKTSEIRTLGFTANNNLLFNYADELWRYSRSKKSVKKIIKVRTIIRSIQSHPKHDIIAIGQERDHLAFVSQNGETIHQFSFAGASEIKKIAWHPTKIMCAAISGDSKLYLIQKQNDTWSFEELDVVGRKLNISFSPKGDDLAIFTAGNTYLYSLNTKDYINIFSGFHKNQGATFSRDWQYAVFPSKNMDVLLFSLKKLSEFPEYFATPNMKDKQDNIWSRRVQQKFLQYIEMNK
ncbi:serine/threonine protein kinase [Candidatus Uabimicrobium amorphum]|uniref:Protein kinase n=1 Tax=Uabimicrobium amorphum TaxID=2596890 RepID=A0A5S9IR79_UABAM|nr:serine/threonine-protein kinase [Candidatus Uabimicrobium amorphum]BBM86628.1 protein kinase [Candidatus Uabimicrobium amorphum]